MKKEREDRERRERERIDCILSHHGKKSCSMSIVWGLAHECSRP